MGKISTFVFFIRKEFFLLFISLIFSGALYAQSEIPSELIHYPEYIFYNGNILTADSDQDFTIAQALAVRENRIFMVGGNEEINHLAGPATRIIDLKGRSLTPGFIYNDGDNSVPAGDILKDSMWGGHTKPHLGGRTIDEALATLAYIVENEGVPGDSFFFNLQDQWAAVAMKSWNRQTLDEVAPDNPVMVYISANTALANQAMMGLALAEGLPEDHFHIGRDENGEFTGFTGAQVSGFIGREVRPWPDPEWFDQVAMPQAVESLANYARHGVTVATGHMSAPTMTILNRLFHEQPDDLAVRVYPGLDFLRQNPNGEMYLKRMGNLVDFSLTDDRGPMVTIVGASVGPHSGSPDSTFGLLTIYPKTNVIPQISPNTNGYNSWSAESMTGLGIEDLTQAQLRQTDYYNVMLARQHGWNMTGIHNMGSEGIRIAMKNVYEAEQQDNLYVKKLWRPQGFDHNIEWVPEVFDYYRDHPVLKDIVRFGVNLRIVMRQRDAGPLNIQDVVEAQYGMEGLERMAPLKTLLEKGIPFHIEGTEPRDGDANPTWYIQKAVSRVDRHGRVIAENEVLDRKTAFLALTRWAARFIGAENELGSLQPGMLADLVVFDGNIMEEPIETLDTLRPVLTMVGGKVVYEDEGL